MENQYYYFTFGTDERFPFSNGCVKVQASSRSEAVKKFNKKYPPRNDLVNCSFIYDQKAFDEAIIFVEQNHGTMDCEIFSYIHDVL